MQTNNDELYEAAIGLFNSSQNLEEYNISRMKEQIKLLKTALKPFATFYGTPTQENINKYSDNEIVYEIHLIDKTCVITWGDIRRARAIYNKITI